MLLDLDRLPLSRKQLTSIGQATARINLWHGSVRSGKTIASLLAFVIAIATAGPSGLIIICGRSLQTIERNVLEPLQDRALFGPSPGTSCTPGAPPRPSSSVAPST